MIKSKKEAVRVFWQHYTESTGHAKPRRLRLTAQRLDYDTDTRCMFVDWVDAYAKSGLLSEKIAKTVTL